MTDGSTGPADTARDDFIARVDSSVNPDPETTSDVFPTAREPREVAPT